jgi:hypothetical protein
MLKIELKSKTTLITKSLLLNKNIGKLLFENLQTKLGQKKICVFTVTRPTLIFASDPMHFYTEFG